MLPQKNFSPLQLAAFNSIVLSFLLGFIVFLVNPVWCIALVCSAVFFVFCFALINYTLQQFVYRKIKLIYKFISIKVNTKKALKEGLMAELEILAQESQTYQEFEKKFI